MDATTAKQMDDRQLIHALLVDPSSARFYRIELTARMAQRGVANVCDLLNAQQIQIHTRQPTNYYQHTCAAIRNIRNADSVNEAVSLILGSGWDYRDAEGRMNKSPEECIDFLQSLMQSIPIHYDEMHDSIRNLLKMICDAYVRSAAR